MKQVIELVQINWTRAAFDAGRSRGFESVLYSRMTANVKGIAETEAALGVVVYTPAGSESAFDGVLPKGFRLLAQRGESLGERLCNATNDLLIGGHSAVCLIIRTVQLFHALS